MTATKKYLTIKRGAALDLGTCAFCDRQVDAHGVRPGATVSDIRGTGSWTARFCDDCLDELVAYTRERDKCDTRGCGRPRGHVGAHHV